MLLRISIAPCKFSSPFSHILAISFSSLSKTPVKCILRNSCLEMCQPTLMPTGGGCPTNPFSVLIYSSSDGACPSKSSLGFILRNSCFDIRPPTLSPTPTGGGCSTNPQQQDTHHSPWNVFYEILWKFYEMYSTKQLLSTNRWRLLPQQDTHLTTQTLIANPNGQKSSQQARQNSWLAEMWAFCGFFSGLYSQSLNLTCVTRRPRSNKTAVLIDQVASWENVQQSSWKNIQKSSWENVQKSSWKNIQKSSWENVQKSSWKNMQQSSWGNMQKSRWIFSNIVFVLCWR